MGVGREQSRPQHERGKEAEELDALNSTVRAKKQAGQAIRRSMESQLEQRSKRMRKAEDAAKSNATKRR